MRNKPIHIDQLNTIPHLPGVYMYRDKNGIIVYIGKAKDLFRRVHQYFSSDDAVGQKTKTLVPQIHTIETISTPTEFDALLLEAQLIRKFLPKYNVISRDDKSHLYIVITLQETIPHILHVRKTHIQAQNPAGKTKQAVFGPFQSVQVARDLLQTIRHIVPFCTQKKRNGKPCFYTHIGLCHPCPSIFEKIPDATLRHSLIKQYRKQMFRIRDILAGKSDRVIRDMQKDMEQSAQRQHFEEAAIIKRQVISLISLQSQKLDPMIYTQTTTLAGNMYDEELDALEAILRTHFSKLSRLDRIECVDISNISGRLATGSLVVLSSGLADSSQYRKFRIRMNQASGLPNDPAMISEVVRRRLVHREWPYPDLLVVDGGKSSVHAAASVLQDNNLNIALVGLAKRMEEIVIRLNDGTYSTLRLSLSNPAIHVLQRVRDEAHRFAKSYHIHLRSASMKGKRV